MQQMMLLQHVQNGGNDGQQNMQMIINQHMNLAGKFQSAASDQMSNFSGAIGRGIGSREYNVSTTSTQRRNYDINQVAFSGDLRVINRPSIFNSSSEESINAKPDKREVFIQDQKVRLQSPITPKSKKRQSKAEKSSKKMDSQHWPIVSSEKKDYINLTDQSSAREAEEPNEPSLLINSFPDVMKFPRSPRNVANINLNQDLAEIHDSRQNLRLDTQKLQELAQYQKYQQGKFIKKR